MVSVLLVLLWELRRSVPRSSIVVGWDCIDLLGRGVIGM
jgi:hypothetical protein